VALKEWPIYLQLVPRCSID